MSERKSARWLGVFTDFIKLLRIDSKEVAAIDEKGSRLEMWGSQKRFLEAVCNGLDNGVRTFYCLKSRQVGLTTLSLVFDVFWLAFYPATIGALVTDTPKNSAANRRAIRRYVESVPKGFFGKNFTIVDDNRDFITFSNGSRLDLLVAGTRNKKTWGEGVGYVFAHLCAAKGTPVVLEHGRIKPIEEVQIGDKVLTHTGKEAKVIDVFGQPGKGKPMIEVSPWMGEPIRYTTWHKIPTQRGLVQAGDLRKDDLLVMPIRKIRGRNKSFKLPETGVRDGTHYVDKEGRFVPKETPGAVLRKHAAWKTINTKIKSNILLNEEAGFAIGYYLAEGCVIRNRLGKPCAITFARHRDEKKYTDRACAALEHYTTGYSRTDNRKNSLTTSVTIYGSSLARWVEDNFGSTDNKHIPDEVFSWGKDFCRGLITGLLCGDGSKGVTIASSNEREHRETLGSKGNKLGAKRTGVNLKNYDLNYIVLPTTRPSLAMQTRDIIASLGYGWGSIKFKDGGSHYGRNCKPCWRVSWSGRAAANLRELMGLRSIDRKDQDFINKYILEKDRVLIKIRSLKECPEENEVWDISVDHPDHTFRTPYMSTSNTEVASYGSKEGLDSFREALASNHPNRLVIYEGTAKGFNHWRDMWIAAKKDPHTCGTVFVGWWSKDLNSIPKADPRFSSFDYAPLPEERELIEAVKEQYNHDITPEQLAWYRWKASAEDADISTLYQNQPWTEGQAFVMTGFSFFATRVLQQDLVRIQDPDDPISFKGYRYILGNDFQAGIMEPITHMDEIESVRLRVWEDPVPNGQYVIGCDPAWGRNDWKDRTAISVWRCFADKLVQVAEYADSEVDPRQAAWILAHLAGAYRDCRINIELTGGPGMAIMTELDHLKDRMRSDMYKDKLRADYDWDDFLQNMKWYLYHRPDSMGAGYAKGTQLSHDLKWRMMLGYKDSHTSGLLLTRSVGLVEEMLTVVQDGSDISAPGKAKDDRVFAAAYANLTWVEWIRPSLIQNGMSYEMVLRMESEEDQDKGSAFVDQIVANFMRKQEEYEAPLSPKQQWLIERGFA